MIARTGHYTFAEFLELIPEDQKADLLEGAIYMASPENTEHNDLLAWLVTLLRVYLDHRPFGRLTVNKVAYRLGDRTAPEPDLGIVCTERMDRIRHGYVVGPPDLAVEIVSPDSVHRDYELKRAVYEQHGVREYWIIDPGEKRATFLTLSGQRFEEDALQDGRWRSLVLPGFALDPNWLWQRPLPPTLPIVQALLQQ